MPKPGEFNNDTVEFLLTNNKLTLLDPFSGAKMHHRMQCQVCNHIWTATPLSKKQTFKKYGVSGCPECNISKKTDTYGKSRTANIQALLDRGIQVLDNTYDGRRHAVSDDTTAKVLVKNINCGHEFYCTPTNLLVNLIECGVCGPSKRITNATAWSKANSLEWQQTAPSWAIYKSQVSALTRASYESHKHLINPTNLPRNKAGVEGAYHLDHIVPVRFCFDNNIPPNVVADPSNLQMLHWRANVGARDHIKGALPPIFLQYIDPENKLTHYASILQSRVFPNAISFHRIGDVVVTLFDAKSNHAVVIIPIDKTYANIKVASTSLRLLDDCGVRATILFEDELTNVDLITSKLAHYTSQNTSTRIHARSCEIRQIQSKEKRVLLDNHHVQGNDASQIAYGAFYENTLVAVMTFSAPRVALGAKNKDRSTYDGIWELSRFCVDTNYRVPGIASKLLTHFQRNHAWKEIYSFADRRWSVGNLYDKLGFVVDRVNPPDYAYVINGVRKHRWNFRKDILKTTLPNFDGALTEHTNMTNHGHHRVWDCGTIKYTLRK